MMIRLLAIILALLITAPPIFAQDDAPISKYPSATLPLDPADILYVVQGGVSKKVAYGDLVAESFGGYWNAASVKKASGCSAVTEVNINSGPPIDTFTCPDADASIIYGSTILPIAITSMLFTLVVSDVDSSSQVYSGSFSAQCRPNDAAMNNTWGTGVAVSITMATANDVYMATSGAVTPDGSCSKGSLLLWRFVIAGTGAHTDDGDARFIGVGGEGS